SKDKPRSHTQRGRKAEGIQHSILATPVGINVIKKIGSKRSRQECGTDADGREQRERENEIVHLALKRAIALSNKNCRFEPELLLNACNKTRNISGRPSNHQ